MNFCVGSLLVYFLVGSLSFQWIHLLPVLITIALAYLLDYFLIVLINLLAFIMEDVNGVKFIYQKILFIIGGTLIPLDFFPEWLKRIIDNLPFGYIIYAPAKLRVDYNSAFFLSTVTHQAV